MLVDLVQITARDGIRLDGALQLPTSAGPPTAPVDGFCLVHGTGGNFYGSTLLESFAERLLGMGCAVLRVNTRGHDGMSNAATPQGGRRLGAAYEVVDDCRHDLAACLDWMRQRVGPRIGLVGHSLGAVKCVYTVAQEPQVGAACIVAVSPPRLSYSWFCTSPRGAEFLEAYREAERLVQGGQPGALLDVKLPLPFVITAAGYVEKYGPDERYNYLKLVPGMPCPTLILLGSQEVASNMAFQGAPEALAEMSRRYPQLKAEIVAGADHFYTGVRAEAVAHVEAWVRSTHW